MPIKLTTSSAKGLESFDFPSFSDGFADCCGLFDVFDLAPSFAITVLLNTCISMADGDSAEDCVVVLSTDVDAVVFESLALGIPQPPLELLELWPLR